MRRLEDLEQVEQQRQVVHLAVGHVDAAVAAQAVDVRAIAFDIETRGRDAAHLGGSARLCRPNSSSWTPEAVSLTS